MTKYNNEILFLINSYISFINDMSDLNPSNVIKYKKSLEMAKEDYIEALNQPNPPINKIKKGILTGIYEFPSIMEYLFRNNINLAYIKYIDLFINKYSFFLKEQFFQRKISKLLEKGITRNINDKILLNIIDNLNNNAIH